MKNQTYELTTSKTNSRNQTTQKNKYKNIETQRK